MANDLQKDVHEHPVVMYLNELTSDSSKRSMRSALRCAMATASGVEMDQIPEGEIFKFAWPGVDASALRALKAALLEKYSSAHTAKVFAAVRGVLGMCFDAGMMDADTWARIQRVKGIPIKSKVETGRQLTDAEIRALAKACAADPSPAGIRDEAIIGLGFTQGPRVAEIVGLELSDYDPESGDLIIQEGKGGSARTIRVANNTKDALDAWIRIRGDEPGALFCPVNKGGNVRISGVSTNSIQLILQKRAGEAGVKRFSAHDLRRTFATNGIRLFGIRPTQRILGHKSIEQTARYDRADLETALKNSERIHFPSMRTWE